MYGAATYRMRAALDLDALGWLPTLVFYVALIAWAAAAWGLVHAGYRALARGNRPDRR